MTNIIQSYNSISPIFVYLNTGVTNKTGNNASYTVLFDTIRYGSGFNTGTGIYTVPISGNYLISTSLLLNNIVSGSNNNLSSISTSLGSLSLSLRSLNSAKDSASQFLVNGCFVQRFSAGNIILVVAQVSGGSGNVVGIGGGTSPYSSWLYIKYLG